MTGLASGKSGAMVAVEFGGRDDRRIGGRRHWRRRIRRSRSDRGRFRTRRLRAQVDRLLFRGDDLDWRRRRRILHQQRRSIGARLHGGVARRLDLAWPFGGRDERRALGQTRHAVLQRRSAAQEGQAERRKSSSLELPRARAACFRLRLHRRLQQRGALLPGKIEPLAGVGLPRRRVETGRGHRAIPPGGVVPGFDSTRSDMSDWSAGAGRKPLPFRRRRPRGLGGGAGLAVVPADHIDQARQFGERVFGAVLRGASGAQAPFEFIEIDFRDDPAGRAAHAKPHARRRAVRAKVRPETSQATSCAPMASLRRRLATLAHFRGRADA